MTYSEKLKDPRWQKMRLKIFERDGWKCICCGSTTETLCVHHTFYSGEPWEAEDWTLETLCDGCHDLVQHYADLVNFLTQQRHAIPALFILRSAVIATEMLGGLECVPDGEGGYPPMVMDRLVFYNLGFTDNDLRSPK